MPDTITTPPDPASLIDREAVARADAARNAVLAAHREAERAVTDAESAVAEANRAADAVIALGGDALAAERAVTDSELTLRAAKRRLAAAAQAVSDAPYHHREAVGAAHAKAADEVARQTLESQRTAAEAAATIKACERRLQELQVMINTFVNNGAGRLHGVSNRPGLIRDLAGEVKLFQTLGFDFSENAQ